MTASIFMFPGQSSRRPDMLEGVLAAWPQVAAPLVEHASEVLGRDLRRHYAAGVEVSFSSNHHVQVGVFLANHLRLAVLADAGVVAPLSLGLSLGEYNHLVHIGALSFEGALRLVDTRGRLYDEGPRGAMAAVFPVTLEALRLVVERARTYGVLEIANLNSPTQYVLSGDQAALDVALAILDDEEGVVGRVIESRIPMHCSRFAPVAEALRSALEGAPWQVPTHPYIPNVEATPLERPARERIVELLGLHVHHPVRWRESIDWIADEHPGVAFVEVGPSGVLHGLLQRSWRTNPRFKTDTAADLRATIAARVAA